jgi:hypothetical protein
VRTKQKAAALVEQRLARQRTEAFHDARALAIVIARGEPSARFDPMKEGVVLQPGETVYRQLPIWIRVQENGRWAEASYADVIVTDQRLLCRFATGRLSSLWWCGVVGLNVDIATERIVLDFGDGQQVCLSGHPVASVAVAGIAAVYGMEAVLTHPALSPLRRRASAREDVTMTRSADHVHP